MPVLPSKAPLPEWKRESVRVADRDGRFKQMVSALRYRFVAVHPCLDGDGYTLTHVPSGLLVLNLREERAARHCGEVLMARCPNSLAGKQTAGELITALPLWVKPWVLACRDCGGYLDPKPFIQDLLKKGGDG